MAIAASNRTRLAGASFILFCSSLLLIAYSSKNPELARIGSAVLGEIVAPLQNTSHGAYSGVQDYYRNYLGLLHVREELVTAKERLASLESQNSNLLELENENKRLRGLLSVIQSENLKGVAAEVIGYDPSSWLKAVTINKGRNDGIEIGMPVLEGSGVVGQVISVGSSAARVILIIDHGSGVDSIIQGSRARGVVSGAEGEGCEMRYVMKEEEIKIGDRVVTSGMDGVFPKGLFVGLVSDIARREGSMFSSVVLRPAVDFSKLETVLVVTNAPLVKTSQEAAAK